MEEVMDWGGGGKAAHTHAHTHARTLSATPEPTWMRKYRYATRENISKRKIGRKVMMLYLLVTTCAWCVGSCVDDG